MIDDISIIIPRGCFPQVLTLKLDPQHANVSVSLESKYNRLDLEAGKREKSTKLLP